MNRLYSLVDKICNIKSSSSDNNVIILINLLWAFLTRGCGLLISLLSTPAFIRYFENNTVLGVWYTLLSVLLWFLNFDLGLGNGIRNNLVQAFTLNDYKEARLIVSSGFFSIGVVSLIVSFVGMFVILNIDLNTLLNVSSQIISKKTLLISAVCILASVMLRFYLSVINSIFYSLQLSSVNNLLALVVSLLQYIFVIVFRFENPEKALIAISIAYFFTSNIPIIIAGFILFQTKLKECRPGMMCVKGNVMKKIITTGGYFFTCQILYMLIINTNEFLITLFFEPAATTEYTLYYKVTSLIAMLVSLVMTPVWSVVTKAITEDDWKWLDRLYKMIKFAGAGIVGLEFMLLPFLQLIMDFWLGDESIKVNMNIAVAFAFFGAVFVYSSMLSTIVCGMGHMKLQLICYGIGVCVKFIYILGCAQNTSNWSTVVWSNFVVLLPYCVVQQISLNRLIKSKLNSKIM